jgi:pimeloyl-ACP methyl ester carboxylesterase
MPTTIPPSNQTTHTIAIPFEGSTVPVLVSDYGPGRPVLLLHGGGGPATVDAFARHLAAERGVRVLVPTHPGFGGTERPERISSIRDLAALYAALLEVEGLTDVTVIGNSIGGWIAAELAALGTVSVARLVVIDGAGLDLAGHPTADFFSLTFDQLAELSYARPDVFRIDPTALPEPARAAMAGNRASLLTYAGSAMVDPTLASRLATIAVPTLVVWGDHDRMIDVAVGEAFANAIPGARFELLANTGHLPQLETPDAVVSVLDGFL